MPGSTPSGVGESLAAIATPIFVPELALDMDTLYVAMTPGLREAGPPIETLINVSGTVPWQPPPAQPAPPLLFVSPVSAAGLFE